MSNWLRLESALSALPPGASVLEAGTGGGAFFGYLLDLLTDSRAGWHLTTVDRCGEACRAAENRLAGRPRLASRVTVIHGDVVEMAYSLRGRFAVVSASALLSAVPLAMTASQEEVIGALAGLTAPGGWVLVEDYLPLAPPEPGGGGDPAAVARALWRLEKAVAELAGRPHYQELSPGSVGRTLGEHGMTVIECGIDERQMPRTLKPRDVTRLWTASRRPPHLDPALWAAIDRYRLGLLRELFACSEGTCPEGSPQWSGSFRLSARRLCPG